MMAQLMTRKYFWNYEVGIENPKFSSQTIKVGNGSVTVVVSLIPTSFFKSVENHFETNGNYQGPSREGSPRIVPEQLN